MIKSEAILYNQYGNPVTPERKIRDGLVKKKSIGLYPNMYMFPEYGNFRPRFYTLSDSEQGLDSLSRELLVRWSREMFGQLGFVATGADLKASYCVGNEYFPKYTGTNKEWGRKAEDWLVNTWYPNCCTRGHNYDFRTALHLFSYILEQDGDILQVFVKDANGWPRFQFVMSHRIKTTTPGQLIESGKFKGCKVWDGVVYTPEGTVVGYNVVEPGDIVNLVPNVNEPPKSQTMLGVRESRLWFDPKFFDKGRGRPAISPSILQAISIQELYSYLQEKIKLEACVGLIERNEAGEAPLEYANVLAQINSQAVDFGSMQVAPTTHGVQVINGPSIRYVKANGGELTTLKSDSPPTQTMDFLRKYETQILACMGVPHALIYSPENISGRIVSGVTENFRTAVSERQFLLDKFSKLIVGYALANAIELGLLPGNDTERLDKVFEFTHPKKFDMDEGYTRAADIKDYESGLKTLTDIVTKNNKSIEQHISEQTNEGIMFVKAAQEISKTTGVDLSIAMTVLRSNLKQSTTLMPQNGNTSDV